MKLLICTQVVDTRHPILGFFHGWILEFAKHFTEVHVICLQKGASALPSNVFVYSLGKETGESHIKYLLRFYRYFTYVFFRVRVDFVFFHMGYVYNNLAAPFFFIRKLLGTQFFWWKTHGTLTVFGRTALFLVDAVYTAAAESFPLESKKKRVVGHAIAIADEAVLSTAREQPPVLLFVGRVTPIKRVEYVIDVAQELISRGISVSVRIVGVLADAAYEDMLREKIAHSAARESITIVGPLQFDEINGELARATVLMNPSETGGIDKVVLEAMQCGTPAVALGETYGPILDRFSLSVSTQSVSEYVRVIQPLLTDPNTIMNMRRDLREEVIKNHALGTLTKRIFNI